MFKKFMQTNKKKIQKKNQTNEKEHKIKIIFRNKENKY